MVSHLQSFETTVIDVEAVLLDVKVRKTILEARWED